MRNIELRPDLRTSGGEVSDIMVGGQVCGTLTLVYREGDRVAGAVQIKEESLKQGDKARVVSFLQNHIQSLVHAVRAETCDVIMTYSTYDQIVTTDSEMEMQADKEHARTKQAGTDAEAWGSAEYELVTVNETGDRIDYHIYDDEGRWLAEASLDTASPDVEGIVRWVYEPSDEEIEMITELLVSDFDDTAVDSLFIDHRYEDEVLETVELTHEDLLDTPLELISDQSEDDYDVILARDDNDVLTYEIFKQSAGGLPVGTATVDIESTRLTGFIEFSDRHNMEDAEAITSLLLRELDKEKDYDGLHLSLMYKNERVDEIVVDYEQVH
ncbi:hypothetical protein BG53_00285 [Paenibacillus darwinianus]|uniref:Uncharacterized protein n=1 Tax=Paenibacillus darwinianus TaxID=1380763 RepID=A0A9W5W7V3_9BACL|nr:hypothetical protein [Paenibacillus darwinianus]EXX88476.1 hypothetical protein BG52_02090 [Paenibacillus darwinianus]EXX89276.1 hypothetical protein BG53_00285 [Paenibacillus darwinianus]EXX89992.1 hypothetical protein CH50_00370 [Paenibacillus darwinianus]